MYYCEGKRTVKVDDLGDGSYVYRSRLNVPVVYNSPLIEAVPTDKFINALDLRLEKPETDIPKEVKKEVEFIPGQLYRLLEFGSLDRIFRLEKVVQDDEKDSVIMSLVKGAPSNKFGTLEDWKCDILDIEFKPGMMIFPKGMAWTEYDPSYVEYDPSDLSTYQGSMLEGEKDTIRYMLLRIGGFSRTKDSKILTMPNGSLMDTELVYLSLGIRVKVDVPGISSYPSMFKGDDIKYAFIMNSFKGSEKVTEDDICDCYGNIYVILDLRRKGKGISPLSLKGKKASDIFEVYWNDCFSVGVKEDVKEIKTVKDVKPKYDRNIFKRVPIKSSPIYWRKLEDGKQKYINPQLR